MELLVFDDPSTWVPSLADALGSDLSNRLSALRKPHEYVEDSLDTLLKNDGKAILRLTLGWVSRNRVAAYHGTRLSPNELHSIRERGLAILAVASREARLRRALSAHPNWMSVAARLESAVDRGGAGVMIGNRSGQAHLTLSKVGLTKGFNHYLTHGSEFDQRIAHQLLGDEGVSLLASDGVGYLLEFSVPGDEAIAAANRYISAEEMIERGEAPNVVRDFLKVLSYRVYDSEFSPENMRTDCGLVFYRDVPPDWLVSAVAWQER